MHISVRINSHALKQVRLPRDANKNFLPNKQKMLYREKTRKDFLEQQSIYFKNNTEKTLPRK
jgi:hypothetical protein